MFFSLNFKADNDLLSDLQLFIHQRPFFQPTSYHKWPNNFNVNFHVASALKTSRENSYKFMLLFIGNHLHKARAY